QSIQRLGQLALFQRADAGIGVGDHATAQGAGEHRGPRRHEDIRAVATAGAEQMVITQKQNIQGLYEALLGHWLLRFSRARNSATDSRFSSRSASSLACSPLHNRASRREWMGWPFRPSS